MRLSALAAAASVLFLAASAEASLIKVSFEGANSSATSPNNNSLGAGLATISGYLIYDTETAGTPFVSNATREAINYFGAITEFAFSTGSVSGSRTGNFGSVQVSDQFTAGQDRLSFNNITLTPGDVSGEAAGISNLQFTIGLAGLFSALSDATLPGAFDPAIFTGQKNLGLFIALLDPASQPGVAKSLNFNFTSVTVEDVTAVPVPAALGLFAFGAAALAGLRRRKARA